MTRDVIVVGAGPVGLMAAAELRLGGLDVVVYERQPAPPRESRGASFTRRTAESFDQRGLLGRLGATEAADSHFGGVPIDLSLLEENHAGVRGVSQFRTERMLEAWADELGVPVRRSREITGLRQAPDGVTVTFDGPDGPGEDSAAYLVGCDGGRSTVRTLTGVEFPGPVPTRGFYTADVTGIDTRLRRIGENLPDGSMIMAMDLEAGVTRVVVYERGTPPRDRAALTYADLADAWQRLTGESIHHGQCRWLSCFTDASRVAARYRQGRVFLAGDAVHVQPPAMAQGLSVGVQDAVNLGWKLAAAVRGWAPDGLLDSYEAERRPIGRQLARNARAAIELRLTGAEMDPVRDVLGELLARPGAAGYLAAMMSGLGIRYDMSPGGAPGDGHPLLGLRMPPDRELITPDGRRTRVADRLHAARGLLIIAGPGSGTAPGDSTAPGNGDRPGNGDGPGPLAAGWADRVDIVTGAWADDHRVTRAPALDAVLIRPDGYVAWASPDGEGEGDLPGALGRWFGTARPVTTAAAATATTTTTATS